MINNIPQKMTYFQVFWELLQADLEERPANFILKNLSGALCEKDRLAEIDQELKELHAKSPELFKALREAWRKRRRLDDPN